MVTLSLKDNPSQVNRASASHTQEQIDPTTFGFLNRKAWTGVPHTWQQTDPFMK